MKEEREEGTEGRLKEQVKKKKKDERKIISKKKQVKTEKKEGSKGKGNKKMG